jgi:2,4-didehydro-3-deoxy-L-rhamnonate hydrolase
MKLIRFGEAGKEKPGVCIHERNYDVSGFIQDYNEAFFENGGLAHLQWMLSRYENMLPLIPTGSRLGPPVSRPSKIVCIGLNYIDHARETNSKPPTEPVIFMKATTAIVGPFDDVVIGKKASYVNEENALDYVAGYTLHNDISERAFQLERGGTWDKGKGCDTFAPLGPYLVTADEIPDIHQLRLWLSVNGKMVQDGNTNNLIFNIPHLIAYTSQFMTLLPGDIISTGTPAGVGLGMNPPVFLKPGDVMELGIDGLGVSRQKTIAYGQD